MLNTIQEWLTAHTHELFKTDRLSVKRPVEAVKLSDLERLFNCKTGDLSDGYHTFNDLYAFRMQYNAAAFNAWAVAGLFDTHKSKHHSDGEPCFDGTYFIVVAQLPEGQISNHYKLKYWDYFQIPERAKSAEFDGHSPVDVLDRLEELNNAR